MRRIMCSIGLCAALSLLGSAAWGDTVINFDGLADGTNIDSAYAGVTFSNPAGSAIPDTNVYARSVCCGFAASGTNVVSVFQTGLPDFGAFYGGVEARFSTAQGTVSIDAAAVDGFESLGTPNDKPFIEAFDSSNHLVGITYYTGTLPTGVAQVEPYQTLTVTSATDNIAYVILSSQQNQPGPPIYGLFDNLCYSSTTNSNSCGGETGGLFLDSLTGNLPNPNGGGSTGVPEPGTLAMFAPALAALAGLKFRSKAKAGGC